MDGLFGVNERDKTAIYIYVFDDLTLSVAMDLYHPLEPIIQSVAVVGGNKKLLKPKLFGIDDPWVLEKYGTSNLMERIELKELIEFAKLLAERAGIPMNQTFVYHFCNKGGDDL